MIVKRYILVVAGLLTGMLLFAQGGASIRASVDKNRILIGEPILLTIKAHIATGSASQFPVIDTIDHFEIQSKPKADTLDEEGGIGIERVYTITSFDSGRWVIPPFVISGAQQSDSIPIDVVFSEFDPSQDYHDIKDILEVKVPKKKLPWWYIAGGILLAILVYVFIKRKPIPKPVARVRVNAYEEAMKSLQDLELSKPATKEFYSVLINIFRQYVLQRKGIQSLQKTTDDLVVQLKGIGLPRELFDQLAQSLRMGDFVKFAKYQPAAEDNRKIFETIKAAIQHIEQAAAAEQAVQQK